MIVKATPKLSAHKQVQQWMIESEPSDSQAFVFHNPEVKKRSKIVIAHRIAQILNSDIKVQDIPVDEARKLNLKYHPNYEPIYIWLLRKG